MDIDHKLIVVLGMHRSGTSAITRGLQVMGVSLGETLYGPLKEVNVKGFWEDIYLNDLDVEMLNTLGRDWHRLTAINRRDVEMLRNNGYFLRAVELLRQKVSSAPVFGLKDPRLTKLLPFWEEVFNHCQFYVGYVLAVRHPLSVVKSLSKRDSFDAEKGYLLWLGHVINSLTGSGSNKRVVVDYDLMMQSPDQELYRIAKTFGLTIDPIQLQIYKSEFLDQGLRHTVYQLNDLSLDAACPPLVREVYAALLDVASDKLQIDDPAFHKMIQHWATEFARIDAALALVDRLNDQKIAAVQTVGDRDNQVSNLKQEVTEREGRISDLCQTVAEREGRISDLSQTIAEREGQIANLHQVLAERDGLIAAHRAEIEDIYGSKSWRLTKPIRVFALQLRKGRKLLSVLPLVLKKEGGVWPALRKTWRVLRNEGMAVARIKMRYLLTDQESISEAGASTEFKLSIVPYYFDPRLDSVAVQFSTEFAIAVHLHLYHTEMLREFVSYLNNIPVQYDLYVSVPESCDSNAIRAELQALLSTVNAVIVEPVPNRGRDIAPLIIQFGKRLAQYEIIAHLHTKKSPHNEKLTAWCQNILTKLMGSPDSGGGHLGKIFGLLQTTAKIVYPEGSINFIKDRSGWADNYDLARGILKKYTQLSIHDFPVVEFPEGSMFWARAKCLKEYLNLPLSYDDFPAEPIPADGTLPHALERLILIFASTHQGQCIRIHTEDSIKDYRQYEEQGDYSSKVIHPDIKVLAYYLPQFHAIPENDLWHGEGFTEWSKVRAANPLFEGHYQQHIPHCDIGYYLLDSPETLRFQAELMRKSGVHGQVFYHYWFTGKLILEKPAQLLLDTPDIAMPFCFCWANENWTRSWDGNENEILLGQSYSGEDAHDFIQYLMPFFKDARYIRIDDRPVLFVYRPSSLPDAREYLDIWQRECEQVGIKRPYVVAVLTRGATNPKEFGMDAGVERVLHDWTGGAVPEINDSLHRYWPVNGSVLHYEEVANFYMRQTEAKDFTYFRSLVPIWDNTARYGSEAYLLHGSMPQRFQEWMESSIAYTQATLPTDRRFLLINAWNEWAEGAHLEPDSRYGYSYLNSVGRALSGLPYSGELNLACSVPAATKIHLSLTKYILDQLKNDDDLKQRFTHCLSRSSIFNICSVSINAPNLIKDPLVAIRHDSDDADFILEFRKVAFFDASTIEKMLQTACASGAAVIANTYDGSSPLIEMTENGSVHAFAAHTAPLVLFPKTVELFGYKNFRMRSDARCFAAYPSLIANVEKPVVTTIIRFHKSDDLNELKNALYCLYAMKDCLVIPLIAAQDLSKQQIEALENTINGFSWVHGCEPQIHFYQSQDGKGDLRSKMLNESLKQVKTHYAAFLDFDDLLMPHAYSWLIGRLQKTGKAVSFGRVYSTSYDSATGLLLERKRVYDYGYSYEEFVRLNHAPLHSFMLDMERLDLGHLVYYEDQRFMEDYLLTLQLFTKDNGDWASLKEDCYIGDYIHSVDRAHTLAFIDDQERQAMLVNPAYKICEQRICDMRKTIESRASDPARTL